MVSIVLHGLHGQNNKGRQLFDKRFTNGEKMGARCLIKEFPNNTTTLLEYFSLLNITFTFVVADGPLTSINQTCSVNISGSVCFTR